MASIVLSGVGGVLGSSLLPGMPGRILGSIGRQVGRNVAGELGFGSVKDGPRLQNLAVQDSRYGRGIPLAFGRVRVAGNVIWASELIETAHEQAMIGGKGGGIAGALGGSRTTYSYSVHCAVAIAAGPIGGIATIWADSKVIYQNGVWMGGVVGSTTFYDGGTTQDVDPFLESMLGAGQVPSYRGTAYMVLESLQLKAFGNRLPNLTFEILPVDAAPQPRWLGSVDANLSHALLSLRNGGMPPLVIEGSAVSARRMLLGGYTPSGATAAFTAVEFDVTGDAPLELARTSSTAFTVGSVYDHSWALAPDGRFVASCMTETSGLHRLAIYDTAMRQFGTVLSVSLTASFDAKQVAWIDAQHFVVTDSVGGKRGLQVFARAGVDIISLGFFDVWGAGSAATTAPLYYTQFIPMAGGLLHLIADTVPNFSSVTARWVGWQNNALTVGAAYTLVSGIGTGAGSGAQIRLLRTGEEEWTLFYGTVVDMRLLSFVPQPNTATITRPWQTLTNGFAGAGTSVQPIVFGNRIVVVQRSSLENKYRLSEIALNSGSFSLVTDGVAVDGFNAALVYFGTAGIDGARLLLMGVGGAVNDIGQCAIIRRRHTGATLDNIVSAVLGRAGYAAGDYDVAALGGVGVDGYVLPDPMTAAAALEPLQMLEPFDLVESGSQLKAVKLDNAPMVAVSEFRATDRLTSEPIPAREQVRTQELDLPIEITVDYQDAARDYEIGSQRARRSATRGARAMIKLNLPLVCTAARAKRIAEERLFTAWAEREQVRVRWSRRWLAVEVGDVVDLGDRLLRVARLHRKGGLLEVEGALIPAAPVSSAAVAESGLAGGVTAETVTDSALFLMDLPLLRAEDDQPGVYVAAGGVKGWKGGELWRAADGVSYSPLADFAAAATAGIAVTALADRPSWYKDREGTVQVQLLQGTLASCTETDLLNGANVALLGNEIVQFQTAVLAGPGLYTLSGLLRGRRGTEDCTGTHAVGEAFVLLTPGTVQFLPALLTDRGRSYQFRALSVGQSLGDAADVAFAYGLLTLQPLAPTHIAGSRSAGTGSDLTLSWKRRARKNADWVDYVDVPLDEDAELYDVEIMNGASVARSFNGLTSPSAIYTAAQQTADWGGSVPATVAVRVYQVSGRYGRGRGAGGVV